MHKILFTALLILPMAASAYGNRNWMTANQFYTDRIDDNTYSWGYNYRMNGKHTTVKLQEDRQGWMHNGNLRHGSAHGIYHWKKLKTAR